MFFTTVWVVALLNLSTPILAQFPDPEIDLARETLCEGPLNRETWVAADLENFMIELSLTFPNRLQEVGFQNLLIEKLPGAQAAQYTCGPDATCDLGPLNDNCGDDPPIASVLKGMANWSNYFQERRATATDVTDVLTSGVSELVTIFNPDARPPVNEIPTNQARMTFILSYVVYTILANSPIAARDIAGVTDSLIQFAVEVAAEPEITTGYDEFANIVASSGALKRSITECIRRFIDSELNNPDVFRNIASRSGIIPQLEDGDFAEPGVGETAERDQLTGVINSAAINRLWIQRQTLVAKFTADIFPDAANACEGDNIFPASSRFCDEEGNVYVLRRIPLNLQEIHEQNDFSTPGLREPFDVAGVDNLAEFGLNVEAITTAAERNQGLNGVLGAPNDDDFVQRLLELNLATAGLSDAVFITLPVCDMTDPANTPDAAKLDGCANSFPDQVNTCLFNVRMVCGCPLGNPAWPYRSEDDFICNFAPVDAATVVG